MGPLEGVRVVEIGGLGPSPFCGMMLADMGADVLRIDRFGAGGAGARYDLLNRGKRSIAADLKNSAAILAVLRLVERADIVTEGFRPGVMERLGLGPERCFDGNPALVYGRMTGFGQDGPLAHAPGHDINYIALAGSLHAIGAKGGPPIPPLNLVGDFGGGGMMLAFGVLCALLEARRSGRGQVVDASMVDGAAALGTYLYGFAKLGLWKDERGTNMTDGGAHFYSTYETSDGRYIALGAIEPQFYAELIRLAGLDPATFAPQMDQSEWPLLKQELAAVIKARTLEQWSAILEGSDACYSPVLSPLEAPDHPHNKARGTFTAVDGVTQPSPTPKFSRTKPEIANPPPLAGQDTDAALTNWGFGDGEIAALKDCGAIA